MRIQVQRSPAGACFVWITDAIAGEPDARGGFFIPLPAKGAAMPGKHGGKPPRIAKLAGASGKKKGAKKRGY